MRLIADGASGISCCNLLPLNSPSGKGGGAEGFGIGGANGGDLEKPSELSDGDTTAERDLGVEGTLLCAGVFKSTSGDLLDGWDTEGALLDGRDAEDALLDAGVFKSTRGDLLDAGVSGKANDEGV